MGKKNIKPQQKQPIIRSNTAKSITDGLTEENFTQGFTPGEGAIPSNHYYHQHCSSSSSFSDDA